MMSPQVPLDCKGVKANNRTGVRRNKINGLNTVVGWCRKGMRAHFVSEIYCTNSTTCF